ncbi:MAG: histidine phosphatase family protein [Deltaproteobacteria bacterium]|nr:histidine phosphatase family protein [Deltaproteobacteria bacterium]
MKIVLLRHGKPYIKKTEKLKAAELHRWIDSYNSSGIHKKYPPGKAAIHIANECRAVVCSDFRRSIESAEILGKTGLKHIDPLFREMGLPYGTWKSPKASPVVWAAIFRALWFFGYASNSENFSSAKKRASQAADKLEDIAKAQGSVLFVGHGFMNRYIAKDLLSNGWQGPHSPGKKYWEFGLYEYKTT